MNATQSFGYLVPLTSDPASMALAIRGFHKQFPGKVAVDRLSLDIPRGTFYGIVGPNGAGKTTTLTMATGLLRPDAGEAWLGGVNVWEDPAAAKAQVGILADGLGTFNELTGMEILQFSGLLRGIGGEELERRCKELLQAMDLVDAPGRSVKDYSAGMTKKIQLACALVHAPKILILDEPFEAVDPVSAQVIREILRNYVRGGGTVVLSSHVMELVEGLCDHVAIIADGQVRAAGPIDDVRGGNTLSDTFMQLVGQRHLQEGTLSWLQN